MSYFLNNCAMKKKYQCGAKINEINNARVLLQLEIMEVYITKKKIHYHYITYILYPCITYLLYPHIS